MSLQPEAPEPMEDPGRGTALPAWLLPSVVLVVIVALAAVALIRDPVALDPETPEGTVQTYLQALSDGDYEGALELLHPESFQGCTAADIAGSTPQEGFSATLGISGAGVAFRGPEPEPSRPTIPAGETRQVDVTIRFQEQGVIGGGWETYVSFDLIDEDGFWWLVNEPWPHFTWSCSSL